VSVTRRLLPAVLLLAAVSSARAGDGSLVWKTIESDHFVVHYYEPLGRLAHRVAVVAERSHTALTPVLAHVPEEKTHIVLVDDSDGANGFANVVPRNAIQLLSAAPTGLSVLNDHDDWMYGLVAHEYAHVLHLDTMSGLPRLYNRIFGKVWAPNRIQPTWVIEGLATYQESQRSSGGRVRSSLFDMFLRVAVLRGEELELDAVTTGPRSWPHGTAAYLYGAHFLKYIFDRYGEDKMAAMTHAYGSDPVPFAVNRSISRAVGRNFVDLYQEWRHFMRRKYQLKLAAIDRQGRREGRRMTFHGESNVNPIYTADGKWIVWRQADGKSRPRFRKMPSGGHIGQATDYAWADRAGGFDLLSDGTMLLEQNRVYRTNYSWQDLLLLDPRTGQFRTLTYGMRARDPAVSPDERLVAFSLNGQSQSRLAIMPLQAEAEPRVLWAGEGDFDQVTAPSWSPDGREVAFSAWRTGGFRDILIVDVQSGATREITRDRAIDADPVYSPDGQYLYFSSDRSGIYNIYAHELATGRLYQVTNVIGCAVLPDVSPDGKRLVYQGYDVRGFELYEIELDQRRWLEPQVYVDDRPPPTVIANDEIEVSKPRPYRPLETLAPLSYTATLATDSFGSAINLTTGGGDIAGFHRYSLAGTIGLARGDVSLGASYAYDRFWPGLRIAASRTVASRGGLVVDGANRRYTEAVYGATARLDLPVLRLPESSSTIALDYDVDWFVSDDNDVTGHDPNAEVPRLPETDVVAASVGATWRFADSRAFTWGVGPQEGKSLTASARLSHPGLGSDFHALRLSYRWDSFLRIPWGETPVLAVRLAGGITTTTQRRSGGFVLGGVQDQDIVRALRDNFRAGGTGYLRGYEPRSISGRQFHLLNLEYRQVLAQIERGLLTLPVYLRRLHFAGLMDVGNAFSGPFVPGDLKAAVGGSLRLDLVFGYFAPGTFDIGYARGLTETGTNEFWFLLTSSL
jgi:hypothetical protein